MVVCLELGADLHTAQLMPLPLTVSCFSKIQIGFYLSGTGTPGLSWKKKPLNGCSISERYMSQSIDQSSSQCGMSRRPYIPGVLVCIGPGAENTVSALFALVVLSWARTCLPPDDAAISLLPAAAAPPTTSSQQPYTHLSAA